MNEPTVDESNFCEYELCGTYYNSFDKYIKKFRCPTDYFAYFSILMHDQCPELNFMQALDMDKVTADFLNICQVQQFTTHGAGRILGENDWICYLKNVTHGYYLYRSGQEFATNVLSMQAS